MAPNGLRALQPRHQIPEQRKTAMFESGSVDAELTMRTPVPNFSLDAILGHFSFPRRDIPLDTVQQFIDNAPNGPSVREGGNPVVVPRGAPIPPPSPPGPGGESPQELHAAE